MEVFAGGKKRLVVIDYKNNRNMYLRVNADGSLHVTCPKRTTQKDIRAFILTKDSWIANTDNRQKQKRERSLCGTDGKSAVWGGIEYPVRFVQSSSDFMEVNDHEIVFWLREWNEDAVRRTFYEAASRQIVLMIQERRGLWDEMICRRNGRQLPNITVKYMTSRWGSCTPAKNHISIAVNLIHYPAGCLDYVLLHEYAHILELNHSTDFWNIVEHYMPGYRDYKKLLR